MTLSRLMDWLTICLRQVNNNDMYKEVNEVINNIEENVNVIEGNVVGH